MADLDGDDDLDVCTANSVGDGVTLLINQCILYGDVNRDGIVDLLDVSPFVNLISNGQYQTEADVNQDGDLNLLDVSIFAQILSQ